MDVNDGLNKEQKNKRKFRTESVDGSVVKRHRVLNQNIFDRLVLSGAISVDQWEAANLFIEDLSASGAFPESLDLEARMEAPGPNDRRISSDSISDRRMIFSRAYRSMADTLDEESVSFFMRIVGSPILNQITEEQIESIGEIIVSHLSCLSRFYGIKPKPDPRTVILRQISSR